MYRGELEERAALLHRLGHGKDAGARAPAGATSAGTSTAPRGARSPAASIDAIVERVFGGERQDRRPRKGGAR